MSPVMSIRGLVLVWLCLLTLLALSTASAYLSLGVGNTLLNVGIACLKAGLIAVFFMQLRHGDAAVRLAACAALFFLLILAYLSFGDFLTRSSNPAPWRAPAATAARNSTGPGGFHS